MARHVRFLTGDVFTDRRFSGNPLAVLPDATSIREEELRSIAREFNYAETVFVYPPVRGGTRRLRIFTPAGEVPFAGHPNLGTASLLTIHGVLGAEEQPGPLVFEQPAGDVTITVALRPTGTVYSELAVPAPLSVGSEADPTLVARAARLEADDIRTVVHKPRSASVGLAFLLAEVRDAATIARAVPDRDALVTLAEAGHPYLHLYARDPDGSSLRVRQFCADDPLLEDPATGSANAALGAWLASLDPASDGTFRFTATQGVEMGRPSLLQVKAFKERGVVTDVRLAGETVPVMTGELQLGA